MEETNNPASVSPTIGSLADGILSALRENDPLTARSVVLTGEESGLDPQVCFRHAAEKEGAGRSWQQLATDFFALLQSGDDPDEEEEEDETADD